MPSRIPREKLVAALRHLLRPVVRRLLSWDIPYPVFDEIVRSLFVEVADRDLSLPHKRQTDSRISLVTGIHRKEVSRLRALPVERPPRQLERTVTTRLVGRWMAGAPYADRRGRTRTLPYESRRAGDPSFSGLVREAGFDGPPRSVLDELLRNGVVRMAADGVIELVRDAFVPAVGIEGKLEMLGSDPGEVFSTIAHNIESPGSPWLHRKVVYDNVGSDVLPALREGARDAGEGLVREANALLAAHDRDRNADAPGGRRTRVVVATYYYEEALEAGTPDSLAPEAARLPGRITGSGRKTGTRSKR